MLAILPLWVWIFGAVIVTSAISGVFGMAGGLILMLILAQFVAVKRAEWERFAGAVTDWELNEYLPFH